MHAANCLDFSRSAYLEYGLNNNYRLDSTYSVYLVDDGKTYFSSYKYYYTDNSLDSIVECQTNGTCDTQKLKQTRRTTDSTIELTITDLHYGNSEVRVFVPGRDSSYKYIYGQNSGNPDSLEIIIHFFLHNDTLYIDEKWITDGTPYTFMNFTITPDSKNANICNMTGYTIEKQDDQQIKSIKDTFQIFTETTETGFIASYSNTDTKLFFVKVGPNSSTSIHRKVRPTVNYKNAKHFDLLGRPANSKYIIKVNR
ncbi:hypothetical protein [Fibrobacter sp. UWB10]|uniref:hypothetical protein n=1 Tax=Fibrobacter sp. UWB10 TaxID=1896201 RepID=UPI0024037C73|nr:hypothetical protein [Fibrobacter sp. UWB10]SMP57974.1 hypothetical protein SAMN05720465_2813 [Fibrobacter sp. UWB10]